MSDTRLRLLVTSESQQGGRKYMEDFFDIRMKWKDQNRVLDFAYFAILDGHGGAHAAEFAKKHLFDEITNNKDFYSDTDSVVCKAIRDGFVSTHKSMAKHVDSWPKTGSGHPSTAGTTASVVFIRNGRLYIGHVGDSAVVLGRKSAERDGAVIAHCLTKDHKPDDPRELARIQASGGQVCARAGIQRVVWHRRKLDHDGPVTRSVECENVPFLAVARSLGDLWSYNTDQDMYVVSPEPDVCSFPLDLEDQWCMVLASDGLWNMIAPQESIEMCNRIKRTYGSTGHQSAAFLLTDWAMKRWAERRLRADNTTAVVVFLEDPDLPSPAPMLTAPFSPAPVIQGGVLHRVQSTQIRETPHLLKFQRKPTPGLRQSPRGSPVKPQTPVSPRKVFSFTSMFASTPPETARSAIRSRRHSYHGPSRRPRSHKLLKHKCSFNSTME